jgi:hypothetical protein
MGMFVSTAFNVDTVRFVNRPPVSCKCTRGCMNDMRRIWLHHFLLHHCSQYHSLSIWFVMLAIALLHARSQAKAVKGALAPKKYACTHCARVFATRSMRAVHRWREHESKVAKGKVGAHSMRTSLYIIVGAWPLSVSHVWHMVAHMRSTMCA